MSNIYQSKHKGQVIDQTVNDTASLKERMGQAENNIQYLNTHKANSNTVPKSIKDLEPNASLVYVGIEEPPSNHSIWVCPVDDSHAIIRVKTNAGTWVEILDGEDGIDGIPCTHSWDGTVLTVTSASGTSSADLKGETGDKGGKGDKGEPGADGYTPQRGVDYWTEEEKAEISTYVEEQVGETEDAVSKILKIQEGLINGTPIISLLGAAAEDHTHTTEQISGLSGFAKIETGSYEGAWDGSSDLTTVELTFGFEPKLLLVGHEYGFMLAMFPCSYPSFSWLPQANPPHDVSEIEWDGKNIRWCSGYYGFNQMGQTYYYVAIG